MGRVVGKYIKERETGATKGLMWEEGPSPFHAQSAICLCASQRESPRAVSSATGSYFSGEALSGTQRWSPSQKCLVQEKHEVQVPEAIN